MRFHIISGQNLGKERSSWTVIGQLKEVESFGQAELGFFINAASGNVYLQCHQKSIQFLGFKLNVGFIYNSQAASADKAWRNACQKNIQLLGTQNAAGSTVALTMGDGSVTTFIYEPASQKYIAAPIAKGNQILFVQPNGQWLWIHAGSGISEIYNAQGQLTERSDAAGRKLTFSYTNDGKLQFILDICHQKLEFDYNNPQRISIYIVEDTQRTLLQWYEIDNLKRIAATHIPKNDTQQVDYKVGYQYKDANSAQITLISQTDGTSVKLDTDAQNRLQTFTDGEEHAWNFNYRQQATDIIDDLNNKTTVEFDSNNRLRGWCKPGIANQLEITRIDYKQGEQVSNILYPNGSQVLFDYEAINGLLALSQVKDSNKKLLKNSLYYHNMHGVCFAVDKQLLLNGQVVSQITRTIFNAKRQPVYVITAEGCVSQVDFDMQGNAIAVRIFLVNKFNVDILYSDDQLAENTLKMWCNQQPKNKIALQEWGHNHRGQIVDERVYAKVDATGKGDTTTSTHVKTEWNALHQWTIRTELQQGTAEFTEQRKFDGLQRLIYEKDALNSETTYVFQDVQQIVTTTLPNGLSKITQWDKAGNIKKEEEAKNGIDHVTNITLDKAGNVFWVQKDNKNYYQINDGQGRPQFEIDPLGYVTEHQYDKKNREADVIKYATHIDLPITDYATIKAALSQLKPSADDRRTTQLYDDSNNLRYEIDGEGGVIEHSYDGANPNPIRTLHYANKLPDSIARLLTNNTLAGIQSDPAHDSDSRFFYDKDNYLVGEQVASGINALNKPIGYVTQYIRNGAGHLLQKIVYKNATPLASNLPDALPRNVSKTDATDRIIAYFYPDAKGKPLVEIDGVYRFIEYAYSANGLVLSKRIYANLIKGDPATESDYMKLRPDVSVEDSIVTSVYDGKGREVRHEEQPFGKIIETRYDNDDNKIYVATIDAKDLSMKREHFYRYNAFKQIVAEIDERGAAEYAKLIDDITREEFWQKKAVWNQYDGAGLRTAIIDQRIAVKNKSNQNVPPITLYYYDDNCREIATINAVGAITFKFYNAFNEINSKIICNKFLQQDQLTQLQQRSLAGDSGIYTTLPDTALTIIHKLLCSKKNSQTIYIYTRTGLKKKTTDEDGYTHEKQYDGRGNCISEKQQIIKKEDGKLEYKVDTHEIDPRNLEVNTVKDADGLKVTVIQKYNVHARAFEHIDEAGSSHLYTFDDAGREIAYLDPEQLKGDKQAATKTWDHLNRIKTETDRLRQTKTHIYETDKRTHTLMSSGNLWVSTQTNVHGEEEKISDTNGDTIMQRDAGGEIIKLIDAESNVTEDQFNLAGWHEKHIEPNGLVTILSHNVVGHVVQQVEDPDGEKITKSFTHTSRGEEAVETDANNILRVFEHSGSGLVIKEILDPKTDSNANGLNLITKTTYNGLKQKINEIKGDSTAENQHEQTFLRDNVGRDVGHVIDPNSAANNQKGLNITTQRIRDAAGNVTADIDGGKNPTRHIFDTLNRKVFEIDAMGGFIYFEYDAESRNINKRAFNTKLDLVDIQALKKDNKLNVPSIFALINIKSLKNDELDCVQYQRFNADNQLIYRVDSIGQISEFIYDTSGRCIAERKYANRAAEKDRKTFFALLLAIEPTDLTAIKQLVSTYSDPAQDRLRYFIPDKIGQARFEIDLDGRVIERQYNKVKQPIATIRYAVRLAPEVVKTLSEKITASDVQNLLTQEMLNHIENRYEYTFYDLLKRKIFEIDANGFVIEYKYDKASRVIEEHDYKKHIDIKPITPQLLLNQVRSALKPDAAKDRILTFTYDNAGRKLTSSDNLGHAESFAYEGANILYKIHTDKNGEISERQYDRAGRKEYEISPEMTVTTTQVSQEAKNHPDQPPQLVAKTEKVRITKHLIYDACNNVTDVIEAEGRANERRVHNDYNACNKLYAVSQANVALDDPAQKISADDKTKRPEKMDNVKKYLFYDAWHNVIANKNELGQWEFTVHNTESEMAYQVDHMGCVTQFNRNSFGEVIQLMRYGNRLKNFMPELYGESGIPFATLETMIEQSKNLEKDRSLKTVYDRRGLKMAVLQSKVVNYNFTGNEAHITMAQPTKAWNYNNFGDIILESTIIDNSTERTAKKHTWRDAKGNTVAEVEEVSDIEGYVTLFERDMAGMIIAKDDYATPINITLLFTDNDKKILIPLTQLMSLIQESPDDRAYQYNFDCLGELLTEAELNIVMQSVEWGTDANGQRIPVKLVDLPSQSVTKSYQRDGLGNDTVITLENGATLIKQYEANRLIKEIDVPRHTFVKVNGKDQPIIYREVKHYGYNEFSNKVSIGRQVITVTDNSVETALTTLKISAAPIETINLKLFDNRNLEKAKQDAEGYVTFQAHDAAKQKTRFWRWYTGWKQAASQSKDITPIKRLYEINCEYTDNGKEFAKHELEHTGELTYRYKATNTFGEVIAESDNPLPAIVDANDEETLQAPLRRRFDQAGRLYFTNEHGGVPTIYLYDEAGKLTNTLRAGADNLNAVLKKNGYRYLPELLKWDFTRLQQTKLVLDKKGRIADQYHPEFTHLAPTLPDPMPEPLSTVFSIGDNYAHDFGDYSISWPAMAENLLVARLILAPIGRPDGLETISVWATYKNGRWGVDLQAVGAIAGRYAYELSYYDYFLEDFITDDHKGTPRYSVVGEINVDGPLAEKSVNLSIVQNNDSTLIATGKSVNNDNKPLTGVELWQNNQLAARVAVNSTATKNRFIVDLKNQVTGNYTCKPIYGIKAAGNRLKPAKGSALEIRQTQLKLNYNASNYQSSIEWTDLPAGCDTLRIYYSASSLPGSAKKDADFYVTDEKISARVGNYIFKGIPTKAGFIPTRVSVYAVDKEGKSWYLGEAQNPAENPDEHRIKVQAKRLNAIVNLRDDSDVKRRKPLTELYAVNKLLGLPDHLVIGTAKPDSSCFLDSLAQTLNQRHKRRKFTEKSLRKWCRRYYTMHKAEVDVLNATDLQWSKENDYNFIVYTQDEVTRKFRTKTVLSGRPGIEGQILCRALNLTGIYIAEIKTSSQTHAFVATYYLVTKNGVTDLGNKKPAYEDDIPAIVVYRGKDHAVPLLPTLIKSAELNAITQAASAVDDQYVYFTPTAHESVPQALQAMDGAICVGTFALEPWMAGKYRANITALKATSVMLSYQPVQLGDQVDTDFDSGEFSIFTANQKGLVAKEINLFDFILGNVGNKPGFTNDVSNSFKQAELQIIFYDSYGKPLQTVYIGPHTPAASVAQLFANHPADGRVDIHLRINDGWIPVFSGFGKTIVSRPYASSFYSNGSTLCLMNLPQTVAKIEFEYFDVRLEDCARWRSIQQVNVVAGSSSTMAIVNIKRLLSGYFPYRIKAYDNTSAVVDLTALAEQKDGWACGNFTVTHDKGTTFTKPDSRPVVKETPKNSQILDRWNNPLTETDPQGNTTINTFNKRNRLRTETKPQVTVTDEKGIDSLHSPIKTMGYDATSHVIAIKDANDHVTAHERNLANETIKTTTADGVYKESVRDGHGRIAQLRDPKGNEFTHEFSLRDQKIKTTDPVGNIHSSTYDEFKNKATDIDGEGNKTYFSSDIRRNVVETILPEGHLKTALFDPNNQTIEENDGTGPDGKPVPVKTKRDFFGLEYARTDKGGAIITTRRNCNQQVLHVKGSEGNHGQQYGDDGKLETVASQDKTIIVDEAGHTKAILDDGAGLTTRHYLRADGRSIGRLFIGSDGQVYQNERQQFNACDWMTTIDDIRIRGTYKYGKKGEKRTTLMWYRNGEDYKALPIEYWYAYNAADCMTVDRGKLMGAQIGITPGQGTKLLYDMCGWREQELSINSTGKSVTKSLSYSANGLLLAMSSTDGSSMSYQFYKNQRVKHFEHKHNDPHAGVLVDTTDTVYNGNGWTMSETIVQADNTPSVTTQTVRFTEHDNAGTPRHQVGTIQQRVFMKGDDGKWQWVNGPTLNDDISAKKIIGFDTTMIQEMSGTRAWSSYGGSNYRQLFITPDVNGNIKSKEGDEKEGEAAHGITEFVNDSEGEIIKKSDPFFSDYGTTGIEPKAEYYLNDAAGNQHVKYGNDPDDDSEIPSSVEADPNFHPVDDHFPPPAPLQITATGEKVTYADIARRIFGDEFMAAMIAEANNASTNDPIPQGMQLKIPELVSTQLHNWAGQFPFYDKSVIIGSNTPYMGMPPYWGPPPQEHHHQSFWDDIIEAVEVVIAIVAAVLAPELATVLAGVVSPMLASIVAQAACAAVANAVDQTLSIADGLQKGFSVKGLYQATLAAAETAGISEALKFGQLAKLNDLTDAARMAKMGKYGDMLPNILKAEELSLVTQGLKLLTDKQRSFSWQQLASAGLNAAAATGLNGILNRGNPGEDRVKDGLYGLGEVAFTNVLSAVMQGEHIDAETMAMAAIGTAIGNVVADAAYDELERLIHGTEKLQKAQQMEKWNTKHADDVAENDQSQRALGQNKLDAMQNKQNAGTQSASPAKKKVLNKDINAQDRDDQTDALKNKQNRAARWQQEQERQKSWSIKSNRIAEDNIDLRISPSVNKKAFSSYSESVFRGELVKAGISSAEITSTYRSPKLQANAMYQNLVGNGPQQGVHNQRHLYEGSGKEIVDVFVAMKGQNKSRAEIISAMENKIKAIGPVLVSRHSANPKILGVFDVAPSSISNKKAFETVMKADRKSGLIEKFLTPSKGDPSYHIEIVQPR